MNLRIVAAVNQPQVLAENLLSSPGVTNVVQQRGYSSVSKAFNAALENISDAHIVAFIHQDVYLPEGWLGQLRDQIALIEEVDLEWAVLGVWARLSDGRFSGRMWCSAARREFVGSVAAPTVVQSIDEIVIILNLKHGLRFDAEFPGFHMYGTDIVMEAQRLGLRSYSIEAPVVHNTKYKPNIYDPAYFRAYNFVRRKWHSYLPIYTCCVPVTRSRIILYRTWFGRMVRHILNPRLDRFMETDPRKIAQLAGYEHPHSNPQLDSNDQISILSTNSEQ